MSPGPLGRGIFAFQVFPNPEILPHALPACQFPQIPLDKRGGRGYDKRKHDRGAADKSTFPAGPGQGWKRKGDAAEAKERPAPFAGLREKIPQTVAFLAGRAERCCDSYAFL